MSTINGSQIRAARGLLNWSQDDLAEKASVSRATIQIIESGNAIRDSKIKVIEKTLHDHGIQFLYDYGVRIKSEEFEDFTGPDSCDDFFDHVLKTIKVKGGDVICLIDTQEMLTKVSGKTNRTNIERLDELQKIVNVKCLVTDKIRATFTKPTFEIRMLPEEPTIMPMSCFAYGNQWVGAFQGDQKYFAFGIFKNSSFMHNCQDYFLPRWHMAKPLQFSAKAKELRR